MVNEPNQISPPRVAGSAKWLLVAFLVVVAGALLMELGRTSWAAGQGVGEPPRSGRGVVVVPTQLSRESYGVYLVDADRGKICLYEYQSATRILRLLAVRNFTYDLGLEEYNTQPVPHEMKELMQQVAPVAPRAASQPERDAPAEE